MPLPVTAFTAAICALLMVATAFDTVRQRMRAGVPFGFGGKLKLVRATRSHGNIAEHAPIVIAMMGWLEYVGANHRFLMFFGAVFLVARGLHIIGIYTHGNASAPLPRLLGVVLTWLVMVGFALWILKLLMPAYLF
jgi:uncharacterized membrane protein YecN with MAPEG domain